MNDLTEMERMIWAAAFVAEYRHLTRTEAYPEKGWMGGDHGECERHRVAVNAWRREQTDEAMRSAYEVVRRARASSVRLPS